MYSKFLKLSRVFSDKVSSLALEPISYLISQSESILSKSFTHWSMTCLRRFTTIISLSAKYSQVGARAGRDETENPREKT